MWGRHFTNISIEIRVQPSDVNGFFGLLSNLRGILVNNGEIVDGGQWAVVHTMFQDC